MRAWHQTLETDMSTWINLGHANWGKFVQISLNHQDKRNFRPFQASCRKLLEPSSFQSITNTETGTSFGASQEAWIKATYGAESHGEQRASFILGLSIYLCAL